MPTINQVEVERLIKISIWDWNSPKSKLTYYLMEWQVHDALLKSSNISSDDIEAEC